MRWQHKVTGNPILVGNNTGHYGYCKEDVVLKLDVRQRSKCGSSAGLTGRVKCLQFLRNERKNVRLIPRMIAAVFSVAAIGALDVARTYGGNRENGFESLCRQTL